MTPHTTHFDDCGCVTAKNSVLLAANGALEDTVRVLRARNDYLRSQLKSSTFPSECPGCAGMRAEVEKLNSNRNWWVEACNQAWEHRDAANASNAIWEKETVALRAEVGRLREQKKYAADECVRVSNENVRLRKAIKDFRALAALRLHEAKPGEMLDAAYTYETMRDWAVAALKEAGDGNRETV